MMYRSILLISLFTVLGTLPSFSQSDTRIVRGDFDGDKKQDKITITNPTEYSIYESRTLKLVRGNGKHNTWAITISPAELYAVVAISNEFSQQNAQLLSVIGKYLFNNCMERPPDPILQWMLHLTPRRSGLSDTSSLFSVTYTYQPSWNTGRLEIQDRYFSIVRTDTIAQSLMIDRESERKSTSKLAWMYCRFGNLYVWGSPASAGGESYSDTIKAINAYNGAITNVFALAHGVLVKHDSLYSWVFLSDANTTGAGEKLRWPSIMKQYLLDDIVLVLQSRNPDDERFLYAIDYRKGVIGLIDARKQHLFDIQDVVVEQGRIVCQDSQHRTVVIGKEELVGALKSIGR